MINTTSYLKFFKDLLQDHVKKANHETLQLKDPLENQLKKSTPFKLVAC